MFKKLRQKFANNAVLFRRLKVKTNIDRKYVYKIFFITIAEVDY